MPKDTTPLRARKNSAMEGKSAVSSTGLPLGWDPAAPHLLLSDLPPAVPEDVDLEAEGLLKSVSPVPMPSKELPR